MSYWLHNGFQAATTDEDPMNKFDELLGEAPNGEYTQQVTTSATRLGMGMMCLTNFFIRLIDAQG